MMTLNCGKIADYNIEDLVSKEFKCQCGKKHIVGVEKVIIEKGAIKELPRILDELNYRKIFMVADNNTYSAAGKLVEEILNKEEFELQKLVYYRESDLIPNEVAIGEFLVNIDINVDVIITVGSGVLNDLSKYMSKKLNIPSIIIVTAPSMDGYAADTSALNIYNLKSSLPSTTPKIIIGDVDILKGAPMAMILSGLGDMLGKYSAFRDWRIANIILGEYYCSTIVKIVEKSVQKCIDNIDGFARRSDEAIKNLMEGLILSGIAMSFAGNSRPASGAEHHISHFWETMFLLDGKDAVYHGTKVGIATLAVNRISEILTKNNINFDNIEDKAGEFDGQKWEEDIVNIFRDAAPEIIRINKKSHQQVVQERLDRIKAVRQNWNAIVDEMKNTPSAQEIEMLLKRAGAYTNPRQIGIDRETVKNSIIYAKEIRTRYTILQLLWDLGLSEKLATEIEKYYFNR